MSVASQDTYLNLTTPLSVVGSGGGTGPGVDSVVSGANISTIGASVGDVTVALQADLTNISSVAFVTGGAVTGLSTINGAPVGSVTVPPVFNASTINLDTSTSGGVARLNSGYGDGTKVSFETSSGTFGGYMELEVPSGGIELGTSDSASAFKFAYLNMAPSQGVELVSGEGPLLFESSNSTIRMIATEYALLGGPVIMPDRATISTLTVGSVNGSAYIPLTTTPSFSTLGLSTLQTPGNASGPSSIQTFNSVIGGTRLQGGLAYATVAGTDITYQSALTTTPIVLLGQVDGGTPIDTFASVVAAGETKMTVKVNTVGALPSIPVYYLVIGAA